MLAEAQQTDTLKYPSPTPETPAEMMAYLYEELTAPPRHACPHCRGDLGPRAATFVSMAAVLGGFVGPDGAVHGGKPVGFAFGEVTARPVGVPKWIGHCRLLYVDPAHRAGRSLKRGRRVREGVGVQLIRYLVEEARRVHPEVVLEGSYVPGSHGARLWVRLGLRPYVTYCAYVNADGSPKDARDLFGHRGGTVSGIGRALNVAGVSSG